MSGFLLSPLVLPVPPGWREEFSRVHPTARAFKSTNGLVVLASVDEIQGKCWLHVSVSRRSRTPDYEDLVRVKDDFIGEDEPAYQVFPRKEEHRNFHPNCLHLWHCVAGDPFPDPLSERAGTIGPEAKDVEAARQYVAEVKAGLR